MKLSLKSDQHSEEQQRYQLCKDGCVTVTSPSHELIGRAASELKKKQNCKHHVRCVPEASDEPGDLLIHESLSLSINNSSSTSRQLLT